MDSLRFLGTATTLITYGGFTVLTDPNFLHRGQRAYLGKGLWSKRLTEPAMPVEALPTLDAIVLSHLHGDHFDRVARRGLPHDVPVLTTGQAARRLRTWGFTQATALGTWQTQELTKGDDRLRVTSVPGHHARGPVEALLPPVMGSVLEFLPAGGQPLRVYVTGDTLMSPDLAQIPRRYPDLDLGVWHLGGTRILGMTVTMDAVEGADLLELVQPTATVPVHFDDYGVFCSPLADFLAEVQRRGLSGVRVVPRGEPLPLPLS